MSSESDKALIKRAQNGDLGAFDLLVLKYQGRIGALISRYVSNDADVEDVTQECFIKAFRAIGSFRGDSAFYTWLYRIGANAAKNHLVACKRRPHGDATIRDVELRESDCTLIGIENPESLAMGDQLARTVAEAMETLPTELKNALTLREFEGLSYDDIATVLGCPVGTVRSRIFRAREAIDEKIQEYSGVMGEGYDKERR